MKTAFASHNAVNPIGPADREAIAQISRVVLSEPPHPLTPKLVGPNGETVDLPEEIYQLLTIAVREMKAGHAVSLTPVMQRISTQDAADLLGVSRPTLVKLLETGAIAYEKPGRHRRVLLTDVLEYREEKHTAAMKSLDELTADASKAGLYDTSSTDYAEALAQARSKSGRSKAR